MHNIYHSSPEVKSLCSSALIAGMIAGQVAGGAVGDILGRHLAMTVVMTLQIVGALATATATDGYVSIYTWIAFWRFILGLGCGGVYPLAATITAEANSETKESSKAVALAFSMQGIGYLVAPVLTTLLTTVLSQEHWLCWRLFIRRPVASHGTQEKMVQASAREVPASMFDAMTHEKDLVRKLLGTAGCWFLFDVLFYGNVLFSPVVLSAAFGGDETVRKMAIHTSYIASLAVPGYFVSVIMMGRLSPRFIQAQGFLCMAILYSIIGFKLHQLADKKIILILLYGSTFFFSNYGPNATVRKKLRCGKCHSDHIGSTCSFFSRLMCCHR
jgi:PHS family inorganic phosphate transporter-like MFS transporter